MSLHPCPHCQRHVRAEEASCPFCAGELTPRVSSPPRTSGGLTRAALFAGAGLLGGASVLVGGCSKDKKDEPAPAPVAQSDAAPAQPIDAAPPPPADAAPIAKDAAVPDAAPAKKKKRKKRKKKKVNELKVPDDWKRHNKPYGAPPNRVRRA